MLFSTLILRDGDAFPFSLQSLTYRPNLYVVNGSEEWGQDEQERVKDTISRKEVMPLMKGMETATYNGHNESKEELETASAPTTLISTSEEIPD